MPPHHQETLHTAASSALLYVSCGKQHRGARIKTWSWLVRFITVLAPIAILAVWGASYAWSCVLALSAPGAPLIFKYKSPSGILTLRADSYVLDWDHGSVRLERPRVYDPRGAEIARVENVFATGIQLPINAIVVRARDAQIKLRRLASGRFEFQDYLPERAGPPTPIPYAVSLNAARVQFVDESGRKLFTQRALARDIDVRGVGDNWIASGLVEIDHIGSGRAEIQNMPEQGILIRGMTAGLDLAPVLDHLKEIPEGRKLAWLQDIHSTTFRATGPVSFFIPHNKSFQFETRLQATATGFSYREYRADSGAFDGVVSATGAEGHLEARDGATSASLLGSISWDKTVNLGGKLFVTAPSRSAMPAWSRNFVPSQVGFSNARMDGWLSYRQGTGVELQSLITASSATAFGQTVAAPNLNLFATSKRVRLAINSGSWTGTPVNGAFDIDVLAHTVSGAANAASVNLASLARRFDAPGLNGKASVSALISGSTANPVVLLQANGTGSYPVQGKPMQGSFELAGRYANQILNVDRASVGNPGSGSARAIGIIDLKSNRIHLNVEANGVQLEKLRKNIAGSLTASGILDGTLRDPRFSGKAIVLGGEIAGQQIPFTSALILADRRRLVATELHAVRGAGDATGEVALNWKTRRLSGTLKADSLLLNEFFGDQAIGAVTVPKLTLSGTLDDPRAAGTAYGTDLVLGGVSVDRAELISTLRGTVATVQSLNAQVGGGTVSATGKYDYSKKAGTFSFTGDNLSIERVTPPGQGFANITGLAGGKGTANILPGGKITVSGDGSLGDVFLNQTEFGSGKWNLAYDGANITGGASIGKLDRFFILDSLAYNISDKNIAAQLSILNGSIQDLYTAAKPFFPQLSVQAADFLDTTKGDLDTTVAFNGRINDPGFDVTLLEARNLETKSRKLGTLKAALSKSGPLWTVSTFDWSGEQGTLKLNSAQVNTQGDLFVDAELNNFDLNYLSLIDPTLGNLQGRAQLSLLAKGPSQSPLIHGTIRSISEKGVEFSGSAGFNINLDSVDITQAQYLTGGDYTGGVTARGTFSYNGFNGEITARLPLNYPLEIPDGPAITATLSMPDVDLKDVAAYASFLDQKRSEGKLSGSVSIIGPRSNLALRGTMLGTFASLATPGYQTTLNAAVAKIDLQDKSIILHMNATGSSGGDLVADLTGTLPDLGGAIDQITRGDIETFVHNPVHGKIAATGFKLNEALKVLGTYRATLDADIDVTGPAAEPLLAGKGIMISDTNILLPAAFAGTGPTVDMLFNPHFDLPIELAGISRFRTGLADVAMSGGARLTGSLAMPDFAGTLYVEGGNLRLGAAKITLEPGGTVRPAYHVDSSGNTTASMGVNIDGRGAVTAARYGGAAQRYDINLAVSGDLLKEGGLNLRATSDPPDLTQDEILALLGQTDVLQSIGSGTGRNDAQKRLRDALTSFAVPTLTDPITSKIAQGLGLEYLNIEYNQFEQASVAFAKSLGKGLTLQGRRQLSTTVGNRRPNYEIKLNYRVPSRNRLLSRLVFSIGLDQDRPYKVGLEYGFRF